MTPLCEFAREEGTDKGGQHGHYPSGRCHDYTPIYYELWKDRREEPLTLLEIGVEQGRSLKMWRKFFPNAMIWGWDIDVARFNPPPDGDPRMVVLEVDTGSGRYDIGHHGVSMQEALVTMNSPVFDFVIDDGNHLDLDQQLAFDALVAHMAPGGVYCIEDNDPIERGDVFVQVPEGWRNEIFKNREPHGDSLLQVIHRV